MVKVKKVGVEFELGIINRDQYLGILAAQRSIYQDFAYGGMEFSVDTEYYDDQIEFKAKFFEPSAERFATVSTLFNCLASQPFASITMKAPHYVGTHMHFMLENENGTPVETMSRIKDNVIAYCFEYFYKWFATIHSNQARRPNDPAFYANEAYRFVRNHNILHNLDARLLENQLDRNLRNILSLSYAYGGGSDRPKYQPVIWSLATESGKPFTMEIRCIPNLWMLTASPEEVTKFVEGVQEALNQPISTDWKSIVKIRHAGICRIVKESPTDPNVSKYGRYVPHDPLSLSLSPYPRTNALHIEPGHDPLSGLRNPETLIPQPPAARGPDADRPDTGGGDGLRFVGVPESELQDPGQPVTTGTTRVRGRTAASQERIDEAIRMINEWAYVGTTAYGEGLDVNVVEGVPVAPDGRGEVPEDAPF